jgi:hypothetical protein
MCVYLIFWGLLWFASGALELRYALAIIPIMAVVVVYPLVVEQWPGWPGTFFRSALAITVAVVTILNFQPLVPYQIMANKPTAFGHAYIGWDYLFRGAPEEKVLDLDMPMIRYINTHLNPASDKVYDFASKVLYDAYINVTLFNGIGYDGPYGLHQWDIYSPDALQHFQQERITYAVVAKAYLPQVQQSAIWPHLQEVYRTPDRYNVEEVLFRLKY